jgi:hypothetical protein
MPSPVNPCNSEFFRDEVGLSQTLLLHKSSEIMLLNQIFVWIYLLSVKAFELSLITGVNVFNNRVYFCRLTGYSPR